MKERVSPLDQEVEQLVVAQTVSDDHPSLPATLPPRLSFGESSGARISGMPGPLIMASSGMR